MTANPSFKCVIHHNLLDEEFFLSHRGLFPNCYQQAEPMGKLGIELAKKADLNPKIVMLPFDCQVEAEAMGAKIIGWEDHFGLRGTGFKPASTPADLLKLPPLNFNAGRLKEILKALKLVELAGFTPCLNLSGPLGLADSLLGLNKTYLAWQQPEQKQDLLRFFKAWQEQATEFARLGIENGAKIISISEPLASPQLVGPKMSADFIKELILPLLTGLNTSLANLPETSLIHICGLTSSTLASLPGVDSQVVKLPEKMGYHQAVINLLNNSPNYNDFINNSKVVLVGNGCLNRNPMVTQINLLKVL